MNRKQRPTVSVLARLGHVWVGAGGEARPLSEGVPSRRKGWGRGVPAVETARRVEGEESVCVVFVVCVCAFCGVQVSKGVFFFFFLKGFQKAF